MIETNRDYFRKLSLQFSGLESYEDIGVLEQLCHLKILAKGEICKVKNVNGNVSKHPPPELEILRTEENQTDGRSFGCNYVFNRIFLKI